LGSLASDHAVLIFQIYAITDIKLTPPPAPLGYRANDEHKALWMREFARLMPYANLSGTTLQEQLTTFDSTVEAVCKTTLKLHQLPRPHGVPWWDEMCTTAQTRARLAHNRDERRKATKTLRYTIAQAKRKWAYEKLNEAVNAQDIWHMASVHHGRCTNSIQPLRNASQQLVDDPREKASLFKVRFFLNNPKPVSPIQITDPLPCPPRTWDPISSEEITLALLTASNSSALGISRIGYKILKWAYSTHPDTLTLLFNLCLESGTHPWKHTKVVVINKLDKPDYSLLKAY
jgi:hypothetical protein